MERLQRERRVPDPGVAVVPVALSAGRLREGRGERRHRRARRHVRQPLDRQSRALDRVTPAMVGDPRSVQPGTPVARRRRDPLISVVDVGGDRELLGPRDGAVDSLAGLEHMARPHLPAFDAEREVGLEANRLSCTRRVGRMAAVVDQRPRRRLTAVAKHRLADELDLDATLEALDGADQHVVCVVVGRRPRVRSDLVLVTPGPHRQRGAHENPAVRRLPGRGEDIRPRLVDPRGRMADAERGHAEHARPHDRAGCRTRSASRSAARRASRSRRQAPRALPYGSWR